MKDAYWFKHDANARHDHKMIALRAKHGPAGYGAFWMLVEVLRETDSYLFPKKHLLSLCLDFAYPELMPLVEDCITEFELLEDDEENIWSPSLMKRMKKYEELKEIRSLSGQKGGRPKQNQSKTKANRKQTPKQNKATRGEEIRKEEIREEDININTELSLSKISPVFKDNPKLCTAAYRTFEKQYGSFMPDQSRQIDAMNRLLKLSAEAGEPDVVLQAMMKKMRELKEADSSKKGFWRTQPFLPTTLVSLWSQVREHIKTEVPDEIDWENLDEM